MKRDSRRTFIVLIFALLFMGCLSPEEKKARDKKLEQMRQMAAAEIPVHPSFSQIDSTFSGVRNERWCLHFFYQSPASYDYKIRDFYLKELAARGWTKFEERTAGGNTEVMSFRKGEYSIHVNNSNPKDQDWDYAIDYCWDKP
jgi:hypothetical protein